MEKRMAPVIMKVYDLILWFLPKLDKFPRSQKFLLGDRIESMILKVMELLIEANYSQKRRKEALYAANLELDKLRLLIRISKDAHYLDFKAFVHQAKLIDEIGRMVGGWNNQAASSCS